MSAYEQVSIANQVAAASPEERSALLVQFSSDPNGLARALKNLYFDSYSSLPALAAGAADALDDLAVLSPQAEILALASWTRGMAALQLEGAFERAIQLIDAAAEQFGALEQPQTAAATQVSKIYALAMLGRYDEAIACGLRTREVFLAYGDILSAGKVEQNLGNLYHRRDQYPEAERFYRAARDRFLALGDQKLLTYANNGLANVLSLQYHFRDAAQLYEQALFHAEAADLEVTRAEIECNLGNLELFQGHYDRALDYLERSRRRYTDLHMPLDSAVAEQELADAYLALNLAPEAAAIYERVSGMFTELGRRAEQARTLLNHGLACLQLGQHDSAHSLLGQAAALYQAEGNKVGLADVLLAEAQLAYTVGEYRTVLQKAEQAERTLLAAGARGRVLLGRWLRGESYRALSYVASAENLLDATLRDAQQHNIPQIAQRCLTSLGMLAAARGDMAASAAAFQQAIALIETMRAPLPADEFRTAFIADKLAPYTEMVRLCLNDPDGARVAEAFHYAERARARALLELLGTTEQRLIPRDTFEATLLERHNELRAELNWFYSQINRPFEGDGDAYPNTLNGWQAAVRDREAALAGLMRQLQQSTAAGTRSPTQALDHGRLQQALGSDTALISFFDLNQQFAAFVVTGDKISVVQALGSVPAVTVIVEQLRFQLETLRYGSAKLHSHMEQLTTRTRRHLAELYTRLIRPLEEHIGTRRLIIAPHQVLHYVPFHALHDGARYLIEQREVAYTPSAQVLLHGLEQARRPLNHAVLVGIQDARTPHVREEIEAVAAHFPTHTLLLDQQATLDAVQRAAPRADVLHLACHGHFRPDNPLFSAIELSNGQLTVRDTYRLELQSELVVLSACETGVNDIAPGNELLGLARGFMSAGTPTLLMSLWAVDDASTARTMEIFYTHLRNGKHPAAALRQAQLAIIQEQPHPFFWAPFILLGRW